MDNFSQVLAMPGRKSILMGGLGMWKKVVIRPVVIKGEKLWQFSYFDDKKDVSKNYDLKFSGLKLKQLKNMGYKVSGFEEVGNLGHDRVKNNVLPSDETIEWLVGIGIQNQDGSIRADKRDKWEQINQFVKNLKEVWEQAAVTNRPVKIVDYGCGNAYLTFAAAYFFRDVVKVQIELTGIDINQELVSRNNKIAADLGWGDVKFMVGDIEKSLGNQPVDVGLALHACDTASDKAIPQAVSAGAEVILVAPCCQHYVQEQLKAKSPFELVFEDGILKQRLGDILTDAFRAGWLRTKGYKTDVVQFIDSKHTPKNLMIRAVKRADVNTKRYQQEYLQLKEYWKLEPYL